MQLKETKPAIFIMPRSSSAWKGSEALWITVGGWASAAKRKFGKAFVLSTDRFAIPEEILDYPLGSSTTAKGSGLSKVLPTTLITLFKDILLWRASKGKTNYDYDIPEINEGISMVWEHHDLFSNYGRKIADKFGVPLVRYVHAPQVWESRKWGVKRPVWGSILEKNEAKIMNQADLVACVSKEVSDKIIAMGVNPDKVMISPMAVDPYHFENKNPNKVREELGLTGKTIIGWTGSFRGFHGIDLLVKAFQIALNQNNALHLLLAGDGLLKNETEKLVVDLGIEKSVNFAGRKGFKQIPDYVNAFDIAIVSARNKDGFHYSPLKLREYMAANKATLAPNAGEIPGSFANNKHLMLYEVGDISDMADKMLELASKKDKRDEIADTGKSYILENGTWDVELNKALKRLS